jgi:hypothetical protein
MAGNGQEPEDEEGGGHHQEGQLSRDELAEKEFNVLVDLIDKVSQ